VAAIAEGVIGAALSFVLSLLRLAKKGQILKTKTTNSQQVKPCHPSTGLRVTLRRTLHIMENQPVQPTGCCDPFNPEPWQEKEITWNNKLFVKDHVTSFLHIPLNMGKVVTRNMKLIEQAGAQSSVQLMLSDEKSLWGADIYIDVTKDVPGAQMATISGTFLTKVFEGPYKNVGKWMKEMQDYVAAKGQTLRKVYCCYTTCPRCAKAYGKNYVVIFAQIR